ncbi:hypothetical protein ACS0TY_020989 [Phlomoides rotata]
MGNIGSTGVHNWRRNSSQRNHPPPPPPQPPQPEITSNCYVFAAMTPYPPSQYPNPNAHCITSTPHAPPPYVKHQKAVTIRNNVNLKETLRIVPDEEDPGKGVSRFQITQAVFEKDKGEYHVRVVKQILRVNGMRYELQEIYGIGNSVEGEFDGNDPRKECVICISEPRDTTVLPCRHMCMCSECAKVLMFQTNPMSNIQTASRASFRD